MTKYVPTKAERDLIKATALKLSKQNCNSTNGVHIEPGIRVNLEDDSKPIDMNLRIVSDDPNWNDTDLHDTARWSDFTKGIELSDKGEAEIDFYLYEKQFGDHGDLCCNLQAIFDATGLIRMEADDDKHPIWTRGEVVNTK